MQNLSELVASAASEIDAAADLAALDGLRVQYLGKKGVLTAQLKGLSQLPAEERPAAGQEINRAKQDVMQRINARREALEAAALEQKLHGQQHLPLSGRRTAALLCIVPS